MTKVAICLYEMYEKRISIANLAAGAPIVVHIFLRRRFPQDKKSVRITLFTSKESISIYLTLSALPALSIVYTLLYI